MNSPLRLDDLLNAMLIAVAAVLLLLGSVPLPAREPRPVAAAPVPAASVVAQTPAPPRP